MELYNQLESDKHAREADRHAAQVSLPSLLSGASTWNALKCAVEELRSAAPDDCDVFVQVGDLAVIEARFVEPHTFLFEGLDQNGHKAWAVVHFSQLSSRIVYRPKNGPNRKVTGFNPNL